MNRPARPHRLAPLLTPSSVALIGASPKAGSVGRGMIQTVTGGGYEGRLHFVNPSYAEIDGQPCHPSIADVPERVDLAVIAVANARLEQALQQAIAAGARAATIFASAYIEGDSEPPLTRRLAAMAREAGMPICGANGMGFYNFDHRLRVCGFPPPAWVEGGGNKTFITHSGSAFSAMVHHDHRFAYNLAVSPGQELGATCDEYLDFALEMPTTRVVGLFLETVRNADGFLAALEKAKAKRIPIVVLKVGRTAESAKLAVSHSGALAGDYAAYEAVFDRHGVVAVETLTELANALLLLGHDRRLPAGGLATIHDSGGLRELTVDRAVMRGVPFSKIGKETTQKLAARLDYGLDPINPLDAWGTGNDYEGIFEDCMVALCEDPDTAVGALFAETRDAYSLHEGYGRVLARAAGRTAKPIVLVNNMAVIGEANLASHMTKAGLPVLIDIDAAMAAFRAGFAWRDAVQRPAPKPNLAPAGLRAKWEARLGKEGALDEAESLALMADYGVGVLAHRIAESDAAAIAAAKAIGFPVALKTAKPGVLHKSDVGGVKLGLADEAALLAAYRDLAARLGPRVLVMAMAGKGVELSFGAIVDPQFGPLVLVGAGGVLIEMMKDRRFALPPFDEAEAHRLLDGLVLRPLLDGKRGQKPADIEALAKSLAAFSVLVADLKGLIAEIDINPVLAGPSGAVALDALVVPAGRR
ncbi:MAG TPA: acetate--CoA ligase family protein [Hypericibacter adhaerens]|jgi:acyl-CoA synthetase (NDP forming)|uniref:acetate--CoA ligase family protein n=1 Tax=Hypericibacter adhaerens TaxID=2602016 RepID=UPI001244F4D2|nr:acetate--CoA ligase family protein [Hypericibacter adhaerens]HWA45960.1 acetate--CoA ligase family protein [Hypericibacter adhaerens]